VQLQQAAQEPGHEARVFEDVIPAGDPPAMRSLFAAAFVDHDPLPGQPPGAKGAAYVVSVMHGAHPDLRFAIHDLVAEDDLADGEITERWAGWKRTPPEAAARDRAA
jgi:hypothetical protein